MKNTPIYAETKRLILREVIPEDDAGFFELDSDPLVHQYLGNKPIQSIDDARNVIKMIREQYVQNGIGRWSIIEKETNKFIGWAGLKLNTFPVNNQIDFYDVGYRLLHNSWHKGFATEAAVAVVKYGFDTMGLKELNSMTHVENKASQTILKKIGFQYVEQFKYENEILCNWYSLLVENYRQ